MFTKASLAVGVIAIILSGCQKTETDAEKEILKVEATTPFREDAAVTKEYVCQIHAIRHIEIRAWNGGTCKIFSWTKGNS